MARQPRRNSKIVHRAVPLALMLVDGTRIRQKIKREYEKLRRDLEKARAEVERFQNNDLPSFSRWLHKRFGPVLTELRETSRRLQELERLFLDIETEILMTGVSPGTAYDRVVDRQANSEAREDAPDDPFARKEEEPEQENTRNNQEWPDFDEFFGAGNRAPSEKPRNAFPEAVAGRLKELYRALARRLHPDAQKEMTPQKKEWWHQAQTAYEQGDLEQLEIILTLCEIEETGTTEKTSLSVLQRISRQFRKTLRQMKAQIAKFRKDPAWNFQQRPDREALATNMQRQLTHDLLVMKENLRAMEVELAVLKDPQRRRFRPRRRQAVYDPFQFF